MTLIFFAVLNVTLYLLVVLFLLMGNSVSNVLYWVCFLLPTLVEVIIIHVADLYHRLALLIHL